MPNFGKSALTFTYRWTDAEQNNRHINFTEEDVIDRANGYHMLDFINRFMMVFGLISHESFCRAEKLICHHMPERIRVRSKMKHWLSKNWNTRFKN